MARRERHVSPAGSSPHSLNLALASVAGLGGCVVLLVVVAALFVGLWLDNALNTRPLFILVLLIGSAPVGIYLMYQVALTVIHKSFSQPPTGAASTPSDSTQGAKQP